MRFAAAIQVVFAVSSFGGGENAREQRMADWPVIGNTPEFTRYSELEQIQKGNVAKLRIAWTYHTGNASTALNTSLECTPIVIGGVMYVTSPVMEVIALNAETGEEIWKFNPFPSETAFRRLSAFGLWGGLFGTAALAGLAMRRMIADQRRGWITGIAMPLALVAAGAPVVLRIVPTEMDEERRSGALRGLTWWESGGERRLMFAGGHRLMALDPDTGRPFRDFGDNGVVDLRKGLGREIGHQLYAVTSPGVIYQDLIVLGARVGEGPKSAAPGHIRAFDVRTGRQKWIFHTIPFPGEAGYETWPADAWKRAGGANAWAGMAVDARRGLIFAPTGSASFDFFGGDRTGENLYSNSLVALRAETGKLAWHRQMIHHDLWDYDLPSPPNLATIHRDGKAIDVAVQVVKNGFVFVLDRETGEPVFPVEERPVPGSSIAGEQAWPTQPFPSAPQALSKTELSESDLTILGAEAHDAALRRSRAAKSAAMFTPPAEALTIVTPGFHGGANWSGGALDAAHGWWVVNTNEKPFLLEMAKAHWWQPFPFTHRGYTPFLDTDGYPAVKPPWGRLTEIDLNDGTTRWQVPLGEYPELSARGIPRTGAENAGGALITASGLIFIGATKDRKFRAFDSADGRELWEYSLPAAAHAAPCTYMVNGKQYVAVAAGGGTIIGSAAGDEYAVFALP